jgi:tetratricopeptide (TPR) repeat protein
LAVVVILAAAMAAYWNSFAGPFVFDDLPSIVTNPTIRRLTPLSAALTPPSDGSTVTGRPLLNLSFALNYAWGGLNPASYHVVNLALHILAALTLFGLVRRTLLRPVLSDRFAREATMLAAAVALLWVVHPLQTESVTFVVQRAESLVSLCLLVTLYCFARGTETSPAGNVWLALAVVCSAAGMACKEVMVTAPLFVFLYDRTFVAGTFRDALRRRKLFYAALAASWLPLVWLLAGAGGTRGTGAGLGLGVTWWSYAFTQCKAVVLYLRLACWPDSLSLDYGTGLVSSFGPVAPQAGLLLLLVAGTVVALCRRPVLGFLGAWFFIILAPSSSVVPVIGQTIAEHRMYLPLAAVLTAGVVGLFTLMGKRSLFLVGALAVVCGILTAARNRDYRDALTLWRDTARKQPENYRAHFNLANELAKTPGGRTEAVAEYETAVRLEPRYADAHNNLALELAQIPGREPEAIDQLETALRLRPDYADAHYNLAAELGKRTGSGAEAIAHYEAALRLQPDFPEAHNNLAVELARIPGRLPEAIANYQAALEARPDYPEAEFGLANALAASPGRIAEAVPHYEAALRLRPDYADARYFLAAALAQIPGRSAEAVADYEAVLKLNPNHFLAHYNLANELARDPRRLPEAIAHYEAAVREKPDFAEARNNLAGAYYRSGRLDDAIRQLTAVLELNPANQNARRNLELLESQRHP